MYKYLINIANGIQDAKKTIFQQTCKNLYEEYNIKTHYIYSEETDIQINSWLEYMYYTHIPQNNLIDFIKNNFNKHEVYINTLDESLVRLTIEIKKQFWQPYTKHYMAFEDKSIERELMKWEDTIPYFNTYQRNTITQYNWEFPIVIKPNKWAQSRGVAIIYNKQQLKEYQEKTQEINQKLQEKKYEASEYIIEEYISWPMYTTTYYVDDIWGYTYDCLCEVFTLQHIWIDDFAIVKRTIVKEKNNDDKEQQINTIIKKTINTYKIKNNFVFQDFKENNKGKIKSIEINWRIGWYRLQLYKLWLDRNIFEYVFESKNGRKEIKTNVAAYSIFPEKDWKELIWFNKTIIDKIKKLPSTKEVKINNKYTNKMVWHAKSGYNRLWSIILENSDYTQFLQDCTYIEKVYKNITIQ
jgi:5-formaminoimidazole-4-carboxamide-1-beta-D-ribofuranosyl 5'-monophosphate synthetase